MKMVTWCSSLLNALYSLKLSLNDGNDDKFSIYRKLIRVHPTLVDPKSLDKYKSVSIFKSITGVFPNKRQSEYIKKMLEAIEDGPTRKNNIYEAIMGIGKSSVIMPIIVLHALEYMKHVNKIIIVQPEHLKAKAVELITSILGAHYAYQLRHAEL